MPVISSEATTVVALSTNLISPTSGDGIASGSTLNAIVTVVRDPQQPLGKLISTAVSTQRPSAEVCWLVGGKQNHPNLNPLAEEEWKSLLESAGSWGV